jgi:AraC-like DNA-binding protein
MEIDISLDDMDIFPVYAAEMDRRQRRVFPLRALGYSRHKSEWVNRAFETFNFSFILQGGGVYHDGERAYRVEAPCVLTQWPDQRVRYGPAKPWSTWEELYLIYSREHQPLMGNALLADRSHPVWTITDPAAVRSALRALAGLTTEPAEPGWIERVDLACEALIMASRPLNRPIQDPELARVTAIKEEIDRIYLDTFSVDELAARRGFSRSTFRRHWSAICDVSPHRYLIELRLRHACRLLVETQVPIGAIADGIGFNDRLYFSRQFRQLFGQTASAYRELNRHG